MSVLYLSYNGLMEPIGQSQILPYVRDLSAGRRLTLVTYEKPEDLDDSERRARFQAVVDECGIHWIPMRYHQRPALVSTAYDMAFGLFVCMVACIRTRTRIVHARSTVPAVMGLLLKVLLGPKLIFDTRGFWIDERVRWGLFKEGAFDLRIARWFERRLLQNSDAIFVLSEAAAATMRARPEVARSPQRVHVATTCTDLTLFHPGETKESTPIPRPLTMGYVGTLGHGYLFDPVLQFFIAIRKRVHDARLRIVNRRDHDYIRQRLDANGIDPQVVDIVACDHRDVPGQIRTMHFGVFFYAWPDTRTPPVFTRMGEFLACGVPCVSNVEGKGATRILAKKRAGLVLPDVDLHTIENAVEDMLVLLLDKGLGDRCVEAAREHFSLAAGLQTYRDAYRTLGSLTDDGNQS